MFRHHVQASKAFIDSNVDLVPSLLFLRAMSSVKLSAQFKNDLDRMVTAAGCRVHTHTIPYHTMPCPS